MIKSNYIISLTLFKIEQGSRLTLKSFLFHRSLTRILLTEINFVEIRAMDTDSTFYHSHRFSSKLLLLFCAQKGRMHTSYRNFILISIAIKYYFKRLIWNIFWVSHLGDTLAPFLGKLWKCISVCIKVFLFDSDSKSHFSVVNTIWNAYSLEKPPTTKEFTPVVNLNCSSIL